MALDIVQLAFQEGTGIYIAGDFLTGISDSGGIAVAKASSGFGGGSTGLKGNSTARVAANVASSDAPEATRSGKSGKASRTREEVELVFDKNKAAIYSLYSRALRDNPALQGKVVLEVSIAPSGEVTECRVISSELGDPELERKLVARVSLSGKVDAKNIPEGQTKNLEINIGSEDFALLPADVELSRATPPTITVAVEREVERSLKVRPKFVYTKDGEKMVAQSVEVAK
jgi:hypothetical protein